MNKKKKKVEENVARYACLRFWSDGKCRLVRTTNPLLSLAEINVSVFGSR